MKKYFVLAVSVVAGLFLALGSSLLFSNQSAATAQTPRVAPPQTNNQVNVADVAFLNTASEAGQAFIQMGQLALNKSRTPQVRQFAQAEIQEQQQNSADFARIAPRIGVQPPTTPGAKYQAILARLSQLSGQQFDNAYLDEGGVNSHLEAASVFQREAAFGRNPELLAVANRGLPIINRHFTTASGLTNYRFAQVARRYPDAQAASDASSVTPQNGVTTSQSEVPSSPDATTSPTPTSDTETIVPQRF
jgi:putative membrane protein